ncbi:MAG: hypothetical protein LBM77_10160 [Spirochaetaceae bacterium]|jgi:nucleoid-associated protein YgaU|nr:hypothetical protein [Spirochaetaceae bacterium]
MKVTVLVCIAFVLLSSPLFASNRYYLESVRLQKLATQSFDDGDYDMAEEYAKEAAKYAQMSDDWIATQKKGAETYTVRSWNGYKDCFWNISGMPAIYGNPWKWRRLYEANKARLPEPNNPNLIEPGFVLTIPRP